MENCLALLDIEHVAHPGWMIVEIIADEDEFAIRLGKVDEDGYDEKIIRIA
ncbi:hypothetical protein KGG85_gp81 [Streptomyces phage Tefunt]|uniref:Uncharacterized protein n=1 Tax=Streptomyces phage Tefunt TaxID=2041209 RepID=A0A291LI00_9CAUD|nr:hypothetical protein KGG85_gp81 [Streptomyces phage Tefunt]ATI19020.1 hypothetical protein SEA_TEFUNT_81 [Streptomyces phage Tefunt]QAY15823.1 hypothetical protein SEA_NISHIKIGOI_82 [Streptomyces phage Nishikigoi]